MVEERKCLLQSRKDWFYMKEQMKSKEWNFLEKIDSTWKNKWKLKNEIFSFHIRLSINIDTTHKTLSLIKNNF